MASLARAKSAAVGLGTFVIMSLHQASDQGTQIMQWLTGVRAYVVGLTASITLTLVAYFLVSSSTNAHQTAGAFGVLFPIILLLAVLQLIAQLIFFIHLGQESPPKWNVILFVLTFAAILLVVVSSLWIMANLNYRMPR